MVKLPKIVLGHSISSCAPPPRKKNIVNASQHACILNECFQRSSILIPPPHLHTPSLPPHSSMHVKKTCCMYFYVILISESILYNILIDACKRVSYLIHNVNLQYIFKMNIHVSLIRNLVTCTCYNKKFTAY